VPGSPSSPNTKLNIAIGLFLGLLLGIGLAVLIERLNRRMKAPDEVGEMYGLPVLVEIPESDVLEEDDAGGEALPETEWEAFRMLRARLRYFNVDKEVRSVLVTSCNSQEGKSTVAWHLAASMAMSPDGPRVLLLEADLRAPSIGQQHGLRLAPGLADALADAQPFTSVIQEVAIGDDRNDGGTEATMDVLVAGAVPPNPAELLESRRMMEMLKTLDAMYDFIVLDSAPSLLVSDSMPLMVRVDGVLVVSRVGMATRDSAVRLRDELASLRAPVLGVVANRVKSRSSNLYGYGYGYGYGAPAETPSTHPIAGVEPAAEPIPAPAPAPPPPAADKPELEPEHPPVAERG
jgi:receptor protein-tyrosine kinase